MPGDPTSKHFLDTSVVRPLLHGSALYRKHLTEAIGTDSLYVSQYVLMELRRSFITNLIGFYFCLEIPTVTTVGDALELWSHKFGKSDIKAVLQLIGQLLDARQLASNDPRDLKKARSAVAQYIKRLDAKARRRFKDASKDTTHCGRAAVELKVELASAGKDFRSFLDSFSDTATCRAQCKIDELILDRHQDAVAGYASSAEQLPKNKENRGFIDLSEQLQKAVAGGPDACTCKHCERIGDAVIALDAPRDMQLEHTDRSFNHLCPPIGQPHRWHPSETEVHRSAGGDD